jgi:SAM-dependent methyltransferase
MCAPQRLELGMTSIADLDRTYYPGFVDEHARFEHLVRRLLVPGDVVLDAGAGPGRSFRYDFTALGARVVGVDLDPGIGTNPNVHRPLLADLNRLPFRVGAFDLVMAKYVFEHLANPTMTFGELRRVIRPGGHLVFHTPNRHHYVAIAARATPHRFHEWFNAKRGLEEEDVFPTYYRANDRRAIVHLASLSGFEVVELEAFEPKPAYLFFHPWAYRAGIAYERLVRRPWLRGFRANLIGALRASESPSGSGGC